MKIAVQGCAHGELENIYNTIDYIEKQNNITIDLLLCCGDFQATRNVDDLKSMAVPTKFRSLCTFYKYYSGEKTAPKLTIFIGGNHEASNHLQELPYGGWVAPNIYYLGYAGVVDVAGIRIAGLSGIFKGWDFPKGRYEKPPYNEESLRSCYHIRNLDVFRLKQLSSPIHIMMSHDWPAGITNHGNAHQLIKNKPFFEEEIQNETLGNKPAAELLESLKPDYWFSAHLHVKFAALVKHKGCESKTTKFLALDKCLPKRKFLQVVEIPHKLENKIKLKYDLEWLAILHLTNHLLSVKKLNTYMPGPGSNERWIFTPTQDELDFVTEKFQNNFIIPENFVATAPAHNSNISMQEFTEEKFKLNPQTIEFCEKLSIDDPMSLLLNEDGFHNSSLNISHFESSSFINYTDSEDTPSPSETPRLRNSIRTPLILPNPHQQCSPESDTDFDTATLIQKAEINRELNTTPTSTLSKDISSSFSEAENKGVENSAEPGPKRFKRRNLSNYAPKEDDED